MRDTVLSTGFVKTVNLRIVPILSSPRRMFLNYV